MPSSSTTLTGAVQALASKRGQLVTTGTVTALLADGSVFCKVNGIVVKVTPTTDQPMEAGMTVHLVRAAGDRYALLGGT